MRLTMKSAAVMPYTCSECPRFVSPGVWLCPRCVIRKEDEAADRKRSAEIAAKCDAMLARWKAEDEAERERKGSR